jgi:membrane-associated phospholipid phosphatase
MMSSIKYNKWFLALWLAFLIGGCIVLLLVPKGDEVIWLNRQHRPYWDYFFYYSTELGNGLFYVLIAVWLAWNRVGYGVLAIISFSVTGLTVQFLKKFVFTDMARPKLFLQYYDLYFVEGEKILSHHSFPSGHAATAFSMFFLLSLLLKNEKWGLPFCLLAVVAGFSRIYLAQHFLIDVMAGSVLGVTITLIIYNVWLQRGWNENSLMQKPAKDVF